MARHKCLEERARPVSEQRGASQCGWCGRWLRSGGGLVRHVCASTVDATVHLELPERRHRRRDVVPRIVTGVVAALAVSGDGAGIAVQGWRIDQQQRSAQPSSTCAYAASGCDYSCTWSVIERRDLSLSLLKFPSDGIK